jgi:hypothetical protein
MRYFYDILYIVELLFYSQRTQLITKSNVYIYYFIITLRLVSESRFHHQEGTGFTSQSVMIE